MRFVTLERCHIEATSLVSDRERATTRPKEGTIKIYVAVATGAIGGGSCR